MKIYVARHGETVWNKKGITQGRSNNRLSEDGKEQAQKTAESCKEVKFDIIISSPLCRTIQTANIINQYHKVKIIKDERITEVAQGIFSGKKFLSLTEEEKLKKKKRLPSDGVESYLEAYKRTANFVKDLKQKYNNKTVLVVTHNVIASLIECISKYGDYNENDFANLKLFDNAKLKEIEI